MVRSVLSIVAGIAVLTALSFAIEGAVDAILLHGFPDIFPDAAALSRSPWIKVFTSAYGMMSVAAGGYVTVLTAKRLPLRHAAAMGVVQAGLTIIAMLSPESTHASRGQWEITALLSIPAALAGGCLHSMRRKAAL